MTLTHELSQFPGSDVVIEAATASHVGNVRRVNEDSVLAARPAYFVADGMGGHEAGDLASQAAVGSLAALATAAGPLTTAAVDAAIAAARAAVDAVADNTERGAGCTLSGAVLVAHEGAAYWYVVNIGDSRVYEHAGSTLMQITRDHSLRAELRAEGNRDAERAPRNVITRALGSDDARHDAWLLPVVTGSRLLICSDGLTTELDDEAIRAVLSVGGTARPVAEELVRLACVAGGRDNVSVVIVDTVAGAPAHHEADEDTQPTDFDDTIEITRPVRR